MGFKYILSEWTGRELQLFRASKDTGRNEKARTVHFFNFSAALSAAGALWPDQFYFITIRPNPRNQMYRRHDAAFRFLSAVQMLFAYGLKFPALYPMNDGQGIPFLPEDRRLPQAISNRILDQ